MSDETAITAGTLADALDRRFPVAWAEPWDRVGLVIGDAAALVSSAFVTLDATSEAVMRASACGAQVLVTHHPPYLELPSRIVKGPGPVGTLEAAVRLGIAVISMHTNLDRAPEGAVALPALLGFDVHDPLESGVEDVALIVTYAPRSAADTLIGALSEAGAGRLGVYEHCAFFSEGTGRFSALAGARPSVPDPGQGVDELRIEMVSPREGAAAVLDAARRAHPYEEPVILALEGVRARGVARLGRVCTWSGGSTLGELAAHVSKTLDVPVRVWGEDARGVRRIAVANGSAGSLVPAATAAADVLVAGEVRYHDALGAASAGLALIEAGHDATEWPLVQLLADAVREAAPTGFGLTVDEHTRSWRMVEDADDGG